MTENPAADLFQRPPRLCLRDGGDARRSIDSVAECPATRSPKEALHDRTEQRDCTRKPERRRSLTRRPSRTTPEPRSFQRGGTVPADRSSTHIAIFGISAWTGILDFAPPEARFKRSAILPRYGEISWSMTTGATRRIRTSSPPCLSKPPGAARTIRWLKAIG
jgi:hypothetical protein